MRGGLVGLLVITGCTHSGLGRSTTGTGDTGSGPTGTATAHDCPWTGTWNLTEVFCGSFPYDPWFDDHDSASMSIDYDPEGGCAIEAVVQSSGCKRTESWHFSVPVGTTVQASFGGITACDPDQCTFGATEPACNVGDLADGTTTITIDDSTGSLKADDLLTNTAPNCTIGLHTTWSQ